jgi:RimJ/RimL family protein N-acetyltransferase
LADETVLLRPWHLADVPAVLASMHDPLLRRFTSPDDEPPSEAEVREFVSEQHSARLRGEEIQFAFAEPAHPGAVLGGGSLYEVNLILGRAAIGYWLAPEGRGRGVATHAVRLMAGWAFGELGIGRLELTCAPDNVPSQRVAERCGFTREGLLRSHLPFRGTRRDTVMFSLLPGELP